MKFVQSASIYPLLALFLTTLAMGQAKTRPARSTHSNEATNPLSLSNAIGLQSILTGVVSGIDPGDSGGKLLRISDCNLSVEISAEALAANPGWDLEDLLDRQVYAMGSVDRRGADYFITVSAPVQLVTDQALLDWKNADPPDEELRARHLSSFVYRKPSATKSLGWTPGAVPSRVLPTIKKETSCRTLMRYFSQRKGPVKSDPFARNRTRAVMESYDHMEIATIKASVTPAPGVGRMQLRLPKNAKGGNFRYKAPIQDLAYRLGGWPEDCLVTFEYDQAASKDPVDPAVLVFLIESLITGREIHPEALHANLEYRADHYTPAEAPTLAAMLELIREARRPKLSTRLLVDGATAEEIADLGREERWDLLGHFQFLAARNGLATVGAPAAEVEEALGGIDEASRVLRERGFDLLKNPHVQKRVDAAVGICPQNMTAQLYQRLGAGELPQRYSAEGSAQILRRLAEKLRQNATRWGKPGINDNCRRIQAELERFDQKLHESAKGAADDCEATVKAAITMTDTKDPRTIRKAQESYFDHLSSLCLKIGNLGGEPMPPIVRRFVP